MTAGGREGEGAGRAGQARGRRGGKREPVLPGQRESAPVEHPLSSPAGRCEVARGQAYGLQEERETEEEEAPEEDEEGRVLVPVRLLLMMSLHFVSGSLGRCLPVV